VRIFFKRCAKNFYLFLNGRTEPSSGSITALHCPEFETAIQWATAGENLGNHTALPYLKAKDTATSPIQKT
jgi:hypothetical protein